MKRGILSFLFLIFSAAISFAAPPVYEMPVVGQGTGATVSVTTYTWTQLSSGTTGNLAARTGVFVVNYSSNNASIGLLFSVSAPSEAINVRMAELQPGEWDVFPCSKATELWAISYHTAAENITVQEVKQ